MTAYRWRLRISALASLLALAIVAGASAAEAAPQRPNDHNCRPTTWLQGLVENRTDRRIVLGQDLLGSATQWCKEPDADIRAHQVDSWRAGSASDITDVVLIYLLDNGDLVRFQARVTKGRPVDVRCAYDLVTQPRTYACAAEDAMSADHFAFVKFSLVPIGR